MRRVAMAIALVAATAGVAAWVVRSRGAMPGEWRKRLEARARRQRGALDRLESRLVDWGHRSIWALVAGMVDLSPDDDLLDVACGSGGFLQEHASHVRHVAGLDLSEAQVEIARRRLRERIAKGSAEIVQGDAAALPWADGSFSVVTCMGSFDFFPDPGRAVSEVHRILRPGGRTVLNIGSKVPEGTESHWSRAMGGWVWNEADVRRMLEEAGFTGVSVSYAWPTGNDRLANLAWHAQGEQRFMRGIKPLPVPSADAAEARAPSLVGPGGR